MKQTIILFLLLLGVLSMQAQETDLTGTITDQDGEPVAGAQLLLYDGTNTYQGETDSDGRYTIKVGTLRLGAEITALGYAPYEEIAFVGNGNKPVPVVLTNAVHYKTGNRSSIVLPVKPDPSLGRYYKLAGRDEKTYGRRVIIFEREYEPKANTPYVIFPERDFDITLADYDLESLPDTVFMPTPTETENPRLGICGAYSNKQLSWADAGQTRGDNSYFLLGGNPYFLDQLSSDNYRYENMYSYCTPPFRCFLIEKSLDANALVFIGEDTSIDNPKADSITQTQVFDLQGRRLSGKPARGVYIQNGKKKVVK